MRQALVAGQDRQLPDKASRTVLLEQRRRKKAMFESRKLTTQVVASKGIEEFAAQSDLEFELSGVFVCPPLESNSPLAAARFMSNAGRCIEDELQKLRLQEKLRITCHSP